MTDEPSSDLLGALPRTRPHRRSEKRPARNASPAAEQPSPTPTASAAARATTTPRRSKAASGAKARTPPAPRTRKPAPATGVAVVGTAIQAAAEIAEIGLTLSRKAVRNAIGRLPRP
jgi:hypothetical protein